MNQAVPNQQPLAIVGSALALVIVSLLFSVDWSSGPETDLDPDTSVDLEDGGGADPAATVPDTTVPPSGARSTDVGSESPDAETPDDETTSTAEPTIDELGADAVAEALTNAGFPQIQILIAGGTVTLRGSVPDAASQRAVLNQVGQVPGVEAIVDELTVG